MPNTIKPPVRAPHLLRRRPMPPPKVPEMRLAMVLSKPMRSAKAKSTDCEQACPSVKYFTAKSMVSCLVIILLVIWLYGD